jgi:hypothetical protein
VLALEVGLVLVDRPHVRISAGPPVLGTGQLASCEAISVARSKLSHSTIQ